ncbi:proton-coupled amino acid transporter-like protein pathetic [Pieris napi]|uniref:proton-coupled amino acid transporter-like protein pathetic n=1 Tax=Pieris napi TaxID=78633 RepID=UPI001FB92BCD|nr:proton-coupled amino acid transporter-like protein pathetic [Pieris napi]XP_047519741.1 proton-coupled amino acid transporter-like protein pathetic [Pieris napi]
MSSKEKPVSENFKSTADLTSNVGFQSTLSIESKDACQEKAYNPFEHRQVEHPTTTFGAIAHILKACIGTGVLAMPAAFKNSGLVAGVIGTLFAGLVCTHTVQLVVSISQKVCTEAKKPSMSFAETCGAAFEFGPKKLRPWSSFVKTLIDYSIAVTYISVLCVYVVFMGSSFKEVVDFYFPSVNISIQMYCVLTLVPLALLCQIRNLKYLVPFSTIANILLLGVFGITLYYVFLDLPPITDREMVASITTWPLFMSTVIFAMEGIGVVMPVENEMKNPQRFLGCPGVWNTSMVIVISLFGVVGFFGYVQYGDAAKGSVTLNLPEDHVIAQATKVLMAVVIFFSFALQFYVPMEFIGRLLKSRQSNRYDNIIQISIRTVIVTAVVGIAAAFPNLELVISFVGAIFFSSLGLLIPATIDIVYNWDRGFGFLKYRLIKNILICIISIVALISGAYVSVVGMIEDFSKEPEHVNTTFV